MRGELEAMAPMSNQQSDGRFVDGVRKSIRDVDELEKLIEELAIRLEPYSNSTKNSGVMTNSEQRESTCKMDASLMELQERIQLAQDKIKTLIASFEG